MKVLIAVDGSAFSACMISRLTEDDAWLGLLHHCTVVHCMAPLPPRAAVHFDQEALCAYYAGDAEKVFQSIRTRFKRRGIEADFVSRIGPVAQAIASLAENGRFDLVIMGSHGHGHGALGAVVMGSVTTQVLAICQTPVLIVRSQTLGPPWTVPRSSRSKRC